MRRLVVALGTVLVGVVALTGPAGAGPPGSGHHDDPVTAASDPDTVVVTADDVDEPGDPDLDWMALAIGDATGGFVAGDAPLGIGSYELTTADAGARAMLLTLLHRDTPLAAIDQLGYHLRADAGPAPSIMLQVRTGGRHATLTWQPLAAPPAGTWTAADTLDAAAGRWRSSVDLPGLCASTCTAGWPALVDANPDAVISGAVGLQLGPGGPATGAVDGLVVATSEARVVYDLEPLEAGPETRADCRDGGWRAFDFANLGRCIAEVSSHGHVSAGGSRRG